MNRNLQVPVPKISNFVANVTFFSLTLVVVSAETVRAQLNPQGEGTGDEVGLSNRQAPSSLLMYNTEKEDRCQFPSLFSDLRLLMTCLCPQA